MPIVLAMLESTRYPTRSKAMAQNNSDRSIRPDIIDAAARVFGARGYERATLDEIAARIGMQKGSLYYHIKSKEELLLAIHMKLWGILSSRLAEAMKAAGSDPAADLQQVIRAIVEVVSSNRDEVRVVLRDRESLSEGNSKYIAKNRAAVLKILENIVKRLCREQVAANAGSAQIISYGLMGMTYFVNEWFKPGQYSADTIARTFSTMVVEGLGRSTLPRSTSAEQKKSARKRAA